MNQKLSMVTSFCWWLPRHPFGSTHSAFPTLRHGFMFIPTFSLANIHRTYSVVNDEHKTNLHNPNKQSYVISTCTPSLNSAAHVGLFFSSFFLFNSKTKKPHLCPRQVWGLGQRRKRSSARWCVKRDSVLL